MTLLSIADAAKRLAVSRTTLWRISQQDVTFPQPVTVSNGRRAFVEAELDKWVTQRMAARDEVAA